MMLKICDDTALISAVQAYIRNIKNAEKRRYADDVWAVIYNESAGVRVVMAEDYELREMGRQAVRMRINTIIASSRSVAWPSSPPNEDSQAYEDYKALVSR